MFIPTPQSLIDRFIAPIGWGTIATILLTGIGMALKLLWTLTTNHAEHIQASAERIDRKTDILVALAESQNTHLASFAKASTDSAVALARIETLLSDK